MLARVLPKMFLGACRLHQGCRHPGRALCCMTAFRHARRARNFLAKERRPKKMRVCSGSLDKSQGLYIRILARLALLHTLRSSCVDSLAGLTEVRTVSD